jgi:hypothetical protein
MEGPTDRFGIDRRHPTTYRVELPPWLPQKELKEMVTRFEKILGDQILIMMLSRAKYRHARRSSEMSTSALSNGSHRIDCPRRNVGKNMFGIDNISDTDIDTFESDSEVFDSDVSTSPETSGATPGTPTPTPAP